MAHPFQCDRLTWLAYLLLAFYGYFLNILGPITSFLKDELKLSYTVSSLHFTAFVEICMIFWSADYLETSLGVQKSSVAEAVGLFLVSMILGRFAASHLVQRYPPARVILACFLAAGLGFGVFTAARTTFFGIFGLFITGLGVSGLYPLLLSLSIGLAGSNTMQASARATLASGTAILILSLVLGRLADLLGIRPAYGIVISC